MNPPSAPDKLRLLSVVAHPHDITYTLGTSTHHIERGDTLTAVSLTDGVTTHDEELADELRKPPGERRQEILLRTRAEQAEAKQKEMTEVCGVFGITDVRILPFADNPIDATKELYRWLGDIFYDIRPHIVITHAPYNPPERGHISLQNNDHAAAGQIVQRTMQAVSQPDPQRKKEPHRVAQLYYIGVEFGHNEIDLLIDISDQVANRIKAEALYETQGHTPELARKRIESFAGYAGWWGHAAYAEPYIRGQREVSNYLTVSDNDLLDAQRSSKETLASIAQMARPHDA